MKMHNFTQNNKCEIKISEIFNSFIHKWQKMDKAQVSINRRINKYL